MKLSHPFYLTALMGIALCASLDLCAMEVPVPEETIEYSIMGNRIHPESHFTFLSALKMEYKEFNETAYNDHYKNGIMAKMKGDTSVAIEEFLKAARYRKIPALKFLAETYKQAGQYLDAYKWMVWAYQESILQKEKFTFSANFCDEKFKNEIEIIGKKGIVNGCKVKHKSLLSQWSINLKMYGITKLVELKDRMPNDYETYPSTLEPYLTKEECLAKKYLFKKMDQLNALLQEMVFGTKIEQADKSRLLAACLAKNDVNIILLAAGACLELKGYEKNAEVILKKLVNLGSIEAHYQLGYIRKQQGKHQEGFLLMRHAAENNYAEAQSELGYLLLHGIGTDKNLEDAFKWFVKADKGGSTTGTYNVGSCYFQGNGVEKNYELAKFYLEKSAALGDSTAHNDLAILHQGGLGCTKSLEKAGDYYKKSAEMHDPMGIIGYATYLHQIKNPQAFKIAQEAVSLGYDRGNLVLGLCYLDGLGAKQEKHKGLAFLMAGIKNEINIENNITLPRRILALISILYDHNIVGEEIQFLKKSLSELCTNPAEKLYYEGYFAYFEYNVALAFILFNRAYLLGIEESAEMINTILKVVYSQNSQESDSSEESLGEFYDDFSSKYSTPAECFLDTKEKLEREQNLQDRKEHRKQTQEFSIEKRVQARQNKEQKLHDSKLKAKEKLQRKVAELCSANSLAPLHIGSPKKIQFVFDDSKAGDEVEALFKEMNSLGSKLGDIIDDIVNDAKSNHVHTLTGPLKGYFARHINDFDRLIYRWVGPGKLEILSCQGHYGD